MVYLNADFTGGETKFYDEDRELRVTVNPEYGMAWVSCTCSYKRVRR